MIYSKNAQLQKPQVRDEMKHLLASNSRVTLHTVGAAAQNGGLAFMIANRDDSCTF